MSTPRHATSPRASSSSSNAARSDYAHSQAFSESGIVSNPTNRNTHRNDKDQSDAASSGTRCYRGGQRMHRRHKTASRHTRREWHGSYSSDSSTCSTSTSCRSSACGGGSCRTESHGAVLPPRGQFFFMGSSGCERVERVRPSSRSRRGHPQVGSSSSDTAAAGGDAYGAAVSARQRFSSARSESHDIPSTMPYHPRLPSDILTSCLTTPVRMLLLFYIVDHMNSDSDLHPILLHLLPGTLKDRKTPLGQLQWCFQTVTECIAWSSLAAEDYAMLFLEDVYVAPLFRGFMLAEHYIVGQLGGQVSVYPTLPAMHSHSMWDNLNSFVESTYDALVRAVRPTPASVYSVLEFCAWLDVRATRWRYEYGQEGGMPGNPSAAGVRAAPAGVLLPSSSSAMCAAAGGGAVTHAGHRALARRVQMGVDACAVSSFHPYLPYPHGPTRWRNDDYRKMHAGASLPTDALPTVVEDRPLSMPSYFLDELRGMESCIDQLTIYGLHVQPDRFLAAAMTQDDGVGTYRSVGHGSGRGAATSAHRRKSRLCGKANHDRSTSRDGEWRSHRSCSSSSCSSSWSSSASSLSASASTFLQRASCAGEAQSAPGAESPCHVSPPNDNSNAYSGDGEDDERRGERVSRRRPHRRCALNEKNTPHGVHSAESSSHVPHTDHRRRPLPCTLHDKCGPHRRPQRRGTRSKVDDQYSHTHDTEQSCKHFRDRLTDSYSRPHRRCHHRARFPLLKSMPVLLQCLLALAYREKATELLCRFVDTGAAAVRQCAQANLYRLALDHFWTRAELAYLLPCMLFVYCKSCRVDVQLAGGAAQRAVIVAGCMHILEHPVPIPSESNPEHSGRPIRSTRCYEGSDKYDDDNHTNNNDKSSSNYSDQRASKTKRKTMSVSHGLSRTRSGETSKDVGCSRVVGLASQGAWQHRVLGVYATAAGQRLLAASLLTMLLMGKEEGEKKEKEECEKDGDVEGDGLCARGTRGATVSRRSQRDRLLALCVDRLCMSVNALTDAETAVHARASTAVRINCNDRDASTADSAGHSRESTPHPHSTTHIHRHTHTHTRHTNHWTSYLSQCIGATTAESVTVMQIFSLTMLYLALMTQVHHYMGNDSSGGNRNYHNNDNGAYARQEEKAHSAAQCTPPRATHESRLCRTHRRHTRRVASALRLMLYSRHSILRGVALRAITLIIATAHSEDKSLLPLVSILLSRIYEEEKPPMEANRAVLLQVVFSAEMMWGWLMKRLLAHVSRDTVAKYIIYWIDDWAHKHRQGKVMKQPVLDSLMEGAGAEGHGLRESSSDNSCSRCSSGSNGSSNYHHCSRDQLIGCYCPCRCRCDDSAQRTGAEGVTSVLRKGSCRYTSEDVDRPFTNSPRGSGSISRDNSSTTRDGKNNSVREGEEKGTSSCFADSSTNVKGRSSSSGGLEGGDAHPPPQQQQQHTLDNSRRLRVYANVLSNIVRLFIQHAQDTCPTYTAFAQRILYDRIALLQAAWYSQQEMDVESKGQTSWPVPSEQHTVPRKQARAGGRTAFASATVSACSSRPPSRHITCDVADSGSSGKTHQQSRGYRHHYHHVLDEVHLLHPSHKPPQRLCSRHSSRGSITSAGVAGGLLSSGSLAFGPPHRKSMDGGRPNRRSSSYHPHSSCGNLNMNSANHSTVSFQPQRHTRHGEMATTRRGWTRTPTRCCRPPSVPHRSLSLSSSGGSVMWNRRWSGGVYTHHPHQHLSYPRPTGDASEEVWRSFCENIMRRIQNNNNYYNNRYNPTTRATRATSPEAAATSHYSTHSNSVSSTNHNYNYYHAAPRHDHRHCPSAGAGRHASHSQSSTNVPGNEYEDSHTGRGMSKHRNNKTASTSSSSSSSSSSNNKSNTSPDRCDDVLALRRGPRVCSAGASSSAAGGVDTADATSAAAVSPVSAATRSIDVGASPQSQHPPPPQPSPPVLQTHKFIRAMLGFLDDVLLVRNGATDRYHPLHIYSRLALHRYLASIAQKMSCAAAGTMPMATEKTTTPKQRRRMECAVVAGFRRLGGSGARHDTTRRRHRRAFSTDCGVDHVPDAGDDDSNGGSNGKRWKLACADQRIHDVPHIHTSEAVICEDAHAARVQRIKFHPSQSHIVACTNTGEVQIWCYDSDGDDNSSSSDHHPYCRSGKRKNDSSRVRCVAAYSMDRVIGRHSPRLLASAHRSMRYRYRRGSRDSSCSSCCDGNSDVEDSSGTSSRSSRSKTRRRNSSRSSSAVYQSNSNRSGRSSASLRPARTNRRRHPHYSYRSGHASLSSPHSTSAASITANSCVGNTVNNIHLIDTAGKTLLCTVRCSGAVEVFDQYTSASRVRRLTTFESAAPSASPHYLHDCLSSYQVQTMCLFITGAEGTVGTWDLAAERRSATTMTTVVSGSGDSTNAMSACGDGKNEARCESHGLPSALTAHPTRPHVFAVAADGVVQLCDTRLPAYRLSRTPTHKLRCFAPPASDAAAAAASAAACSARFTRAAVDGDGANVASAESTSRAWLDTRGALCLHVSFPERYPGLMVTGYASGVVLLWDERMQQAPVASYLAHFASTPRYSSHGRNLASTTRTAESEQANTSHATRPDVAAGSALLWRPRQLIVHPTRHDVLTLTTAPTSMCLTGLVAPISETRRSGCTLEVTRHVYTVLHEPHEAVFHPFSSMLAVSEGSGIGLYGL